MAIDLVDPPKKGPLRAIRKQYWSLTGQKTNTLCRTSILQVFGSVCGTWSPLILTKSQIFEIMEIVQLFAVTIACMLFWFRIDRTESTIDDRLGALFFFNVFWTFQSVLTALYTFPAERKVLEDPAPADGIGFQRTTWRKLP